MSSPVSGAIPEERSPQVQVIIDFLTTFCHQDFDKLATLLTDDYIHDIVPRSLEIAPRDKLTWVKSTQGILKLFNYFKFEVHEIVEGQNIVTIHASSDGTTNSGGTYNNEYAMFFELTPETNSEGVKIRRTKEFVNSKFTAEFFPAEKARQEAAGNNVVLL